MSDPESHPPRWRELALTWRFWVLVAVCIVVAAIAAFLGYD
jgi:energy-coupling factor transporter transmembrane protein EcfT